MIGILDTAAEHWRRLSLADRMHLLQNLEAYREIDRWPGEAAENSAMDWEHLPSGLCGRLLQCVKSER